MPKSILHITDLHLNDFNGTDEHLRRRFYREFLDGMMQSISLSKMTVDIIIVSGDFVDKGKTENLEYISEILAYLSDKLNIAKSNICVCIGNHDFKCKEEAEDGSNSKELRVPYEEFADQYNAEVIVSDNRSKLELLDAGVYHLSLDSTLGSHKAELQGKPGDISNEEVDIIVNDVLKENVKEGSLLLISCHYPIEVFPNALAGVSEKNWSENHFWSQAGFLRTRINNIPGVLKIWFLGDTHFPDHLFYEQALFVMTGRFGGTTNAKDVRQVSLLNRQSKIIIVKDNSNIESIYTYNFKMVTHQDSAMHGEWEYQKLEEIRTIQSAVAEGAPQAQTTETKIVNSDQIEKISETIEEKIIERIKSKDLYSFGRFKTSNDHTSLGWISISQLLNEQKILSSIVSKSVDRIEDKLSSSADESAIIGLDFWGAIIGSQVSVRTGVKHFCLATRGYGQYHSTLELKNNLLEDIIPSLKSVVLFIDVISSGGTVNQTLEAIKKKKPDIEFHLISVISNNSELRKEFSQNLSSKGTFCLDLKVPVVNNVDLPDEEILPPNIDFSIQSG